MDINQQHFAFVAVLGAPNAGKSTLVNRMVGAKVSIVSPKVQTTRSRIRGILVEENTQLILVDTPGIFKPSRRLDRAMVASAWTESEDSDLRMLIVDSAKGIDKNTHSIVDSLKKNKQKAILVLNKIDLIGKDKLLPLIDSRGVTWGGSRCIWFDAKTHTIPTRYLPATCQAIDLIPKDIMIMHWSWRFGEKYLQDLLSRGFEVVLGNYFPEAYYAKEKYNKKPTL